MFALASFIVIAAGFTALPVAEVVGECCCACTGCMWYWGHWVCDESCRCADKSFWTHCNGVGKCDVLCCKCDGGCRKLPGWNSSTPAVNPKGRFIRYDTNNDGFISTEELLSLEPTRKTWDDDDEALEHFAAYDVDGDGRVSLHEFEKHH